MEKIKIKGKDYVMVNERLKHFRANYKGWSLTSEIISLDNDSCVIKALVCDENGVLKATGFAQEDRTSSMINKTSFVENCETSAWGRALGNLGIGIDESVASAEEVDMAIKKQEITQPKAELQNVYLCDGCGAVINENVAKYSKDKFGKRLCYNCQKKGV